ncbi:MAG TPA: hypothetical protein VEJ63_06105 [Planctomycetota bacterium]|nr:hypothetical protein [Planctomycetota bacterium]
MSPNAPLYMFIIVIVIAVGIAPLLVKYYSVSSFSILELQSNLVLATLPLGCVLLFRIYDYRREDGFLTATLFVGLYLAGMLWAFASRVMALELISHLAVRNLAARAGLYIFAYAIIPFTLAVVIVSDLI